MRSWMYLAEITQKMQYSSPSLTISPYKTEKRCLAVVQGGKIMLPTQQKIVCFPGNACSSSSTDRILTFTSSCDQSIVLFGAGLGFDQSTLKQYSHPKPSPNKLSHVYTKISRLCFVSSLSFTSPVSSISPPIFADFCQIINWLFSPHYITNKQAMNCKPVHQTIRNTYNFQTNHHKDAKEPSKYAHKMAGQNINSNPQLKLTHSIKQMQSKIEDVQNLVRMKASRIQEGSAEAHRDKDKGSHGARIFEKTKVKNLSFGDKLLHSAWGMTEPTSKLNDSSPIRKSYRLPEPNKYSEESPIKIPPLNLHATSTSMLDSTTSTITHSSSTANMSPSPPRKIHKKVDQSKSYMGLRQADRDSSFVLKDGTSFIGLLNQEEKERGEINLIKVQQKQPCKEEQINKLKGINYLNIKNTINAIKNRTRPKVQTRNTVIQGFEFGKVLGKGKFGEVYMAKHVQTGFIVAIKKVVKKTLVDMKMVNQFVAEIRLHSTLEHPNIVKFYGFFEEKQNIYLVLEYLSGGTLFDYQNEVGVLSTKQTVSFLKDIIDALVYLHDLNIAHRDIKPQNIVISSTGIAKLCDFGWSAVVQSMRETFCGTLDYAPPEIIQRKKYDTTVDLWCIGILTYELFVGRAPFESETRAQVMQRIVNIDKTGIPHAHLLPPQAKDFIEALLQKEPTERPSITQLLDFPLFSHLAPCRYKTDRSFAK